ncbi:putative membrane protein [Parabacteroides sp. PF5-5]|uniref:putative signal transducing protein n=2 Tax=Parabacteroides TaxID=375288 RepID=UPI002475887F|nr:MULTISPECIES: DUF2007 domain-containing protein [unclassified Parabacteroides]MDH6305363.1 putative membrane protein [Parabacteroides sp. PH5-39]MDH6316716.1 putative membrane protein [Parabacteroides sp. PF5-13]MDH6320104.1 putative membrane protein [Parabacteroides sp. PH5-13]MDH6323953.1 putative membrane protein [Parabacteroides sp. PH5-8]MDH6327781.1 putative membrane protein [Parabacteroides sp. PH5-41]
MMDKMVEIARFQYPSQAQTLVALLKSEGIDCYVRNEVSSQVMAGYVDVGGARVELLESEVSRAIEIMKANGYEIPDEDEQTEQIKAISGWAKHIPFLKNLSLERQILFLLLLVAVCVGLLVFMGSLLSQN